MQQIIPIVLYLTENAQHHSCDHTTVIQTPELALWKCWLNARLHSWSGYMPSYNSFLHCDELQPWLIENVHKMFNKFTLLLMGIDIVMLMWKFDAINVLIWKYCYCLAHWCNITIFLSLSIFHHTVNKARPTIRITLFVIWCCCYIKLQVCSYSAAQADRQLNLWRCHPKINK